MIFNVFGGTLKLNQSINLCERLAGMALFQAAAASLQQCAVKQLI